MQKNLILLSLLMVISACSSDVWHGDEKKLDIDGERISVLAHEQKFSKSDMSQAKIKITEAKNMKNGALSGGNAQHLVGNLTFNTKLSLLWDKSIGAGTSYTNRLLAEPVIFNETIYTFDSKGKVGAYELDTGKLLWAKNFINADKDISVIGAGMAIENNTLYLTSGIGDVIAVDIKTKEKKWEKSLSSTLRAAPTIVDGTLFVMTVDSKLFAFDGETGEQKWYYASVPQDTTILGGAAPTVKNGIVVAVFPTGEVVALNAKSGAFLWGEVLSGSARLEGLAMLMDIVARPVIKGNTLYVIGHSDVFIAVNLKTGKKIWQKDIGGTTNPLLVDDYIFTITNDGDLIALEQKNGKTIWVRTLPHFSDEDEEDTIVWQGPIMLDGKLLVVGSYGEIAFLNPENGNLISRNKVAESIQLPPVYADEKLILLNSDANLMVYK